jgi:hypothetical protein
MGKRIVSGLIIASVLLALLAASLPAPAVLAAPAAGGALQEPANAPGTPGASAATVKPERERSPILLIGALLIVAVILVGAAVHARMEVPLND